MKYTIKELKTVGTWIEVPIRDMKFWIADCSCEWNIASYPAGSRTIHRFEEKFQGEKDVVFLEKPDYKGQMFYAVPISELRRLGIVEDERWAVKITEENFETLLRVVK